jgi:alpha-tubulin suppressor-like RCC1 family protein
VNGAFDRRRLAVSKFVLTVGLSCLGSLALSACVLQLPARTTTSTSTDPQWRTPVAVDYGAINETDVDFLANERAFDSFAGVGNSTEAFLNVSTVVNTGTVDLQQYLHRYTPRSAGGQGWTDADYIDWGAAWMTATFPVGQSFLALSPGGNLLAGYSRGEDGACANEAAYLELGVGVALNVPMINDACISTFDVDPFDSLLQETRGLSAADDGAGGYFIARREDQDVDGTQEAYVQRVIAGVLGTDIAIAGEVSDLQAIGDGVRGSLIYSAGSASGENPNSFDAYIGIAVGVDHACGLQGNQVFCWGDNSDGELGLPTSTPNSFTPVVVDLGGTDAAGNAIVAIAAGRNYSCAVYIDGANRKVICWGDNSAGQLGCPGLGAGPILPSAAEPVATSAPCATNALTNLQVYSELEGGKRISRPDLSLGWNTACGVFTQGGDRYTYCWGDDTDGLLGRGAGPNPSDPARVQDTMGADLTDSRSVSVDKFDASGDGHACVVVDGALSGFSTYCWGNGDNSEIGTIGTTDQAELVSFYEWSFAWFPPSLLSSYSLSTSGINRSIVTANSRTCILANSVPYCIGDNTGGVVAGSIGASFGFDLDGQSSTSIFFYDVGIFSTLTQATRMWMGETGIFVESEGDIYAWGYRDDQSNSIFGDGGSIGSNATVETTPNLVWTQSEAPLDMEVGSAHACGVWLVGNSSFEFRCWGDASDGKLGTGGSADSNAPVPIAASAQIGCSSASCVYVADSSDGFSAQTQISAGAGTVMRFEAAADRSGNTAVAIIRSRVIDEDNYECVDESSVTGAGLEYCNFRLFANIRTADGTWTGETQVDLVPSIDVEASSYMLPDDDVDLATFADPVPGRTQYFPPAVAPLGESGQFIFVWALKEQDRTSGERYSRLYSRIYDVQLGWQEDATLIDQQLILNSIDPVRHHHNLGVSCDSAATVCWVLVQFMEDEQDDQGDRSFGWRLWSYDVLTTVFSAEWLLGSAYQCAGDQAECWGRAQPFLHLFSQNEGFVVLPAPVDGTNNQTRLLSLEYY